MCVAAPEKDLGYIHQVSLSQFFISSFMNTHCVPVHTCITLHNAYCFIRLKDFLKSEVEVCTDMMDVLWTHKDIVYILSYSKAG